MHNLYDSRQVMPIGHIEQSCRNTQSHIEMYPKFAEELVTAEKCFTMLVPSGGRPQQPRQNSFTSASAVRRHHPPDPVPKNKIVSPYIVAVDTVTSPRRSLRLRRIRTGRSFQGCRSLDTDNRRHRRLKSDQVLPFPAMGEDSN